MAEVKIKIGSKFDPTGINQAKKAGDELKNSFDGVADGFQKKLVGKAALATAAFGLFRGALGLLRPALEGVTSAGGRVGEAFQTIVTKSGVVQSATAGIRVGLEALAEILESRAVPSLFALAEKVAVVGQRYGNAAVMSDRFKASQKSAADVVAGVNEKLAEQIGLIDDLEKRQTAQAKDEADLEKAYIKASDLSPAQKIEETAIVEMRAARRAAHIKQKAINDKIIAVDAAIAEEDQIIVDSNKSIPNRDQLSAAVQRAQAAAGAEEAARVRNRKAFAMGEGLKDTRRFRGSHEFDLTNPNIHRERLTPDEQRVYDYIKSSGGLEAARVANQQEQAASRAALDGARSERSSAFGALPSGVATPEQAQAYARQREEMARATIGKAQSEQEKLGGQRGKLSEEFFEVGRSTMLREQTAAIEATTEQIESLKKLRDTLAGEEQTVWTEVIAALKEGKVIQATAAQETLRVVREANAETQRQIAQLQSRGPQ